MTPRDSLAAFFLSPDESEENNICHVSTDVRLQLPALFLPLISAVVSLEGLLWWPQSSQSWIKRPLGINEPHLAPL